MRIWPMTQTLLFKGSGFFDCLLFAFRSIGFGAGKYRSRRNFLLLPQTVYCTTKNRLGLYDQTNK